MQNINKITDKILAEAEENAREILAGAKRQSKSILEDYKQEAELEVARIEAQTKQKVDAITRRTSSQADIDSRNVTLGARRQAVDHAFELAIDRLCALNVEAQVAFLSRLILQSQQRDAEVIFSKSAPAELPGQVVEAVNRKSRGIQTTISHETGDFKGGFILREGDIETNCTYEVLVMGVKQEMETQVARVLFG